MKLLDAKCHTTIIYNINKILGYNLTWRENDGIWQEAWPNSRETRISGIYQHTLSSVFDARRLMQPALWTLESPMNLLFIHKHLL